MDIPLIFVAVIIALMAIYMMNRFILRPGIVTILILIIQLLCATVTVFSILENVLTTSQVELGIILVGVILPLPIFIYDYIDFSRRMKNNGVQAQYIEKKERRKHSKWSISFFTGKAELWKGEIPAMDIYRSVSVQDPQLKENLKKQFIMIQRLINLQRYEKAADQYRVLSAIIPDSATVAYNTGYLHCFVGKYREAYKFLRKAHAVLKKEKQGSRKTIDTDKSHKNPIPADFDAMNRFYMGYALYHMGKFEHAIRHFQKVLEEKPGLTVAYKNIARAFLSIGMDDKAIDYLEKGRLDLRDNSMRIVLGSIYYHKGDTKKAIEVLDEVAQAEEKQIEALKWKGRAAIKEKMYDKAIECFKELISIDPQESSHYYHLALAQRNAGEKANALKTYDKAMAAFPTNSLLLYDAGTLMDEMGQREKAVQVLYRSIDGDEILEDAMNYLGVLLGQMKRYHESIQIFDKGNKQFPGSYQLYFNRGVVLEMARRLEDAVESFSKAYELNHKDPVLLNYYTAVLLKVRDYAKAIRICKQGLSNYPDDAELIYSLSKVYSHMGEKDIAVDLLKKLLELDPVYLRRLRDDIDFKSLANHPGYQSLMVS